jgi:signal peptidase I
MPAKVDRPVPFLRRWRSVRVVVADTSMRPALEPGDRLLVERFRAGSAGPRPGDVVVVPDPDGSGRWLVKRVAACGPARVFVVRRGVVVRPADDAGPPPDDAIDDVQVPYGSVFVMSDGGAGGRDSRTFGPVPVGGLVGVAWWRYAPRGRAGPVPEPATT